MKKKQFIRFLALCFTAVILLPMSVKAATPEYTEPLASNQLESYYANVIALGSGKLSVTFYVNGLGVMNTIGVQRIRLYESLDGVNWYHLADFTSASYSNMMAYGARDLISSVPYSGVAGRYYKAFVTVTATNGSGTDTRSFWTAVVRAT